MKKILRLFIAAPISKEIRTNFSKILAPLKSFSTDIKWVEEENFHLTIRFLGATPAQKVDKIFEAVNRALKDTKSFNITFGGAIGAFPNLRRPKVFWIGIKSGGEELASIAKSINLSLGEEGFPTADKEFSPHLTIGRVKSQGNISNFMAKIPHIPNIATQSMLLDKIYLMESDLTPKGPIYTDVKIFPLS